MEDVILREEYPSESASESDKSLTKNISSIISFLGSPKTEPITPQCQILKGRFLL